MPDVRFRCPACGAKHKAEAALSGMVTACMECGVEFTIPPESNLPPPVGVPLPPKPDDEKLKRLLQEKSDLENQLLEVRQKLADSETAAQRRETEWAQEGGRLRAELEKLRAAAESVPLPPIPESETKRRLAEVLFELKSRDEQVARLKKERDEALALARERSGAGDQSAAGQLLSLHQRLDALERARADQDRALAELRARCAGLAREKETLENRLRLLGQAVRHKSG